MFKKLQEKIKNLTNEAHNTGNFDNVKKLKRKIVRIGSWTAILGYIGFIVCLAVILEGITGYSTAVEFWIAVAFVMPCGFIGFIGRCIAITGVKIKTMLKENPEKKVGKE